MVNIPAMVAIPVEALRPATSHEDPSVFIMGHGTHDCRLYLHGGSMGMCACGGGGLMSEHVGMYTAVKV